MKTKLQILPAGESKSLTVADEVWKTEFNHDLVRQYLRVYLTNQHQGTKRVQTRGDVDLTNKKPWPQKGTGRARHGSRKTPLWVGGGQAHGPKPHTKRLKINKKMAQGALRCVLSSHMVTEDVVFGDYDKNIKAKFVQRGREVLDKLNWRFHKVGVIIAKGDDLFKKMFTNLPMVTIYDANKVNAYNIVNTDKLLVTSNALNELEKRLCTK